MKVGHHKSIPSQRHITQYFRASLRDQSHLNIDFENIDNLFFRYREAVHLYQRKVSLSNAGFIAGDQLQISHRTASLNLRCNKFDWTCHYS